MPLVIKNHLLPAVGIFTGTATGGSGLGLVHFINNRPDSLGILSSSITKANGYSAFFAEYIKKEEGESKSPSCRVWMSRGDWESGYQTTKDLDSQKCKELTEGIWKSYLDKKPSEWLRVNESDFRKVAYEYYLLPENDEEVSLDQIPKEDKDKWELKKKNLSCIKQKGELGSNRGKVILSCFPLNSNKAQE